MEKLKDKMEIKMITDGLGSLIRNGLDVICPFIPPVTFIKKKPMEMGVQQEDELNIQKTACNSSCPLFKINDKTVDICCGGTKITHKISKVIPIENKVGSSPMLLKIDNKPKPSSRDIN